MNQPAQRSLCESIDAMEAAFRSLASKFDGFMVDEVVLLRMLLMLAPALDATFDRVVRQHSGIGKTEFRTLMMLLTHKHGCAAPGELCAPETMGRANMTRVGDVLVERGLATRTAAADDRRRVVLSITAKGRKLVTDLVPHLAHGEAAAFEGIDATRRRQMASALRRIAANVDAWNRMRR